VVNRQLVERKILRVEEQRFDIAAVGLDRVIGQSSLCREVTYEALKTFRRRRQRCVVRRPGLKVRHRPLNPRDCA
jgi:hypothetical protein